MASVARWVVYVRRSYRRADSAAVSDEAQEAAARSLIPRDAEVDVIRDSGGHRSGATTDRDGYQELLARLRSGAVDGIAVYDLSRLHRNALNMLALSQELERRAVTLRSKIKIKSMAFMRGRTFLNKFLIIDEAQNLTPKQMKTLITRAGPGTKIVCLGNLAQIDTPYLTEGSSGLTYAVDRFKGWPHGGHVTLARGERSRLADFASDVL